MAEGLKTECGGTKESTIGAAAFDAPSRDLRHFASIHRMHYFSYYATCRIEGQADVNGMCCTTCLTITSLRCHPRMHSIPAELKSCSATTSSTSAQEEVGLLALSKTIYVAMLISIWVALSCIPQLTC